MSDHLPPPIPDDLVGIFRAEREIPPVSSASHDRLLAGLVAAGAVGLAATATAGASTVAATVTSVVPAGVHGVRAAGLLARILATRAPFGLAMFVLGGASGAVMHAKLHPGALPIPYVAPHRIVLPEVVSIPPVPEAPPPIAAPPSVAPPLVVAVGPRAAAHPAPRPAESERRAQIDQEHNLVGQAHTALMSGRFAEATEALHEGDQRFPTGQHAQDRALLWVRVLVAEGRFAEARSRAAGFRQRFPSDAAEVDEALAAIPSGE